MSIARKHMAHNIYSNPELTGTSGKFEGFSIDFRGVQTPISTYWSLCNWGMDLTTFKAVHPDAKGGGAYSGIQNTIEGRKMILSFWEIFFEGESKRQTASRMYPFGGESTFGGEGEGTNYIANYEWKDNTWIRMILRSWKDYEKGTTFVGQWLEDRQTGEWTLASYFDTKLTDSCFTGRMSQFQENFWDEHSDFIREFNLKNIYVKDCRDGEWKYVAGTNLSYDDPRWGFNTAGSHNIGATDEYFYGSSGGDVGDQDAYDATRPISALYRVKRAEEYITEEPAEIVIDKNVLKVVGGAHKVPLLTVNVEVLDKDGKVVGNVICTRPEMAKMGLPIGGSYKVTATDIYGRSKTYEF